MKKIRDLSGFGWDDIQKLVVADEDVWEKLFTVRHINLFKVDEVLIGLTGSSWVKEMAQVTVSSL